MQLRTNIGTVDRVVRIIAGVLLLLLVPLAFLDAETGWALWGLLGLIPLGAGIVGYCPPYALLGINSCKGTETPGSHHDATRLARS